MTNNTEFQRAVFTSTGNVVYVDIRIDLSLVIAYGHLVDLRTGSIKSDLTEVFIQGLMSPIYVKINYTDFHNLIQSP